MSADMDGSNGPVGQEQGLFRPYPGGYVMEDD
jgi:hypothetical protein